MVKAKETAKTKKKFDPEEYMSTAVLELDEKIEAIDRRLAPYQDLINTKNKLMAARRALLGKNSATGGTGTRITLEEVVDYLDKNPGTTASLIAEEFGVQLSTITSHVYRNPGRFVKKDGRLWKRDPEAGVNGPDDVEEEADDE